MLISRNESFLNLFFVRRITAILTRLASVLSRSLAIPFFAAIFALFIGIVENVNLRRFFDGFEICLILWGEYGFVALKF
jgi:hypothetical protein